MAVPQILFPAPPPTKNTLTHQQRTQLMRSTKKLGRVLGITPQLIDISDSISSASSAEWSDEDDFYRPKSRGSVDSVSSSTSLSRSRWGSRTSSRRPSRTSSPASRSLRSSSSVSTSYTEDSQLISDTKPLLRLALSSSGCDFIVGQPSPSSLFSSDDDTDSNSEDLRFTLRPNLKEFTRDSFLVSPDFSIPSAKTLRRAKMDRLRKKLGDDVPVELVFRDEEEMDESTSSLYSADSVDTSRSTFSIVTIQHRPLPPLPNESTPLSSPRPAKTRSGLANARDSLLVQTSCPVHKIKRKPVPKFEVEIQPVLDAERRREKERLSLILELPHEHEDDGVPITPAGPSPISEWSFSDCREEQLLWDIECSNYRDFLTFEAAESL